MSNMFSRFSSWISRLNWHLILPGVLILGLVGIAACLLFSPYFLRDYVEETSDRIALAQLFIGAAAVVAIFIAVWEFGQAQRRPELGILIGSGNEEYRNSPVVFSIPSPSGGQINR